MERTAENKMGVMPVNKLLITMSLPMIISMIIQALYNIVDSIYVSQINEAALTAVSLSFPIQNLMIAFATGTCVGVNALLSRSLGEKNFTLVNKTFSSGILLTLINISVFMCFGFLFTRHFFRAQTNITEIVDKGSDYLFIVTTLCFGIFGEILFERLLQSTGKTLFSMITQATGAITNIILDPVLIFGRWGFKPMGVRGAALATVTGQIIAMVLAVLFHFLFNHEVKLDLKHAGIDGRVIGLIMKVGIPSIAMVSIGSIMNFAMNQILLSFVSTAAAVVGVYFKLQSFVFMPVFGLNNGLIPIIAYNYGARSYERIKKAILFAVIYAVSIMILGFLVFQFFPDWLLGLFDASEDMLALGRPALRIISFSFLLAGFCIVVGSVFQSLGNGLYSLIVSVARQLLILIPVAYLLSLTNQVRFVWLAFPIAEIVSFAVSAYLFKRIYSEKILPLKYFSRHDMTEDTKQA